MSRVEEVTVLAGQDIKKVIGDYVLSQGWESAYISGAVGSVTEMAYTTPVCNSLPLKTASEEVEGAAEVVAFTGEVMKRERMDPALQAVYSDKDNPLFVHIHVSCAYQGGRVRGGGLAKGKAFRSLRVFMIPLEGKTGQ